MRTFLIIISLLFSGCASTQIQVHATYQPDESTKIEISGNLTPTGLTLAR